jgi:hypothetical protein
MEGQDQEPLGPAPAAPNKIPAKGVLAAIFAAGLVIGAIVAGLNVAGAQTPTPSASPSDGQRTERHFGVGPGFGHFGFGPGAIHGEFTTPAPDGGYQTLATQVGEVTSVSSSSVTVKSEDVDDVKEGDTVRVLAIVDGSTARAVDIADETNIDRLGQGWMPPPPEPPSGSSSSTTSSTSA